MTHPDELLAAYVDGPSSDPRTDRRRAPGHVRAMPAGGRQAASRARRPAGASRRRSPPDLGPPPRWRELGDGTARRRSAAPAGSAGRGPPRPRRRRPSRRWCSPRLGGGSSADSDGGERDRGRADARSVRNARRLALSSRRRLRHAALRARRRRPRGSRRRRGGRRRQRRDGPRRARGRRRPRPSACIQKAFHGFPGTLVRLIRPKFQGTPAYIGFYAEGPGAGQPVDALTVRVAALDGCAILSSPARL